MLLMAFNTQRMTTLDHHQHDLIELWRQADSLEAEGDMHVIELINHLEGLSRGQLEAIVRNEGGSDRGIAAGTILAREIRF